MTVQERLKWVETATYEEILRKIRFEPIGSSWFNSESRNGVYEAMITRMRALKSAPGGHAAAVLASKNIGW